MTRMVKVRRLGPADLALARDLNALFAGAFGDAKSYLGHPPGDDYLAQLLGRDGVIAVAGFRDGQLAGALVAYVLDKLEQERSEIYIYDLAVAEAHRRNGVATAMIDGVKAAAREAGAWVIYVQADHGDDPAIALYEKLGRREEVLHFDIAPEVTTLRRP